MSGNFNFRESKPTDGNEEELRKENEVLLKKLQDEFGESHHMSTEGLSESIRNEFLKYVYEMEKQFKEGVKLSIYKIIGEPKYRRHFELSDDDLVAELDKFQELLYKHQIEIVCLYEVTDRELYRFITEELFLEETEVINIEGVYTNYIYEEFHPNDQEDMKADTRSFVNDILQNRLHPEFNTLNNLVEKRDGSLIRREEVCILLAEHFTNFSFCHLTELRINEVTIEGNNAVVNFFLSYEVIDHNSVMQVFAGNGNLGFIQEDGTCWRIKQVHVPGFMF
jgi:hypothetical protein